MSELILRRVQRRDYAALSALWKACFDDTDAFIRQFFETLDSLGGGIAAEIDGHIVGAAYALTALELVDRDGSSQRVGYIYGVGVHREYRSHGVGRAVTLAAAELARDLGAVIIATLPAEDGLYAWYEEILDTRFRLYRKKYVLDSAQTLTDAVSAVSVREYLSARENMLQGVPHLRPDAAAMEFETALLREYGGGLYRVGSAIAAAYIEDGCTIVRELICADAQQNSLSAACAVGRYLGMDKVTLFLPSDTGESYILSDRKLPDGCAWNISFD